MEKPRKHWWDLRNEDLMALAEKEAPLYAYDEETLNEIFFDLLAMDVLAGLFYPFYLNFNPRILQKVIDLDVHFRCNSLSEVNHLREYFPRLPPERIFYLSDQGHRRDCEAAVQQGIHVAIRADNNTTNACLKMFQDGNIFVCMDMGDEIAPSGAPKNATRGIYICTDSRFLSLCSQDEKISQFSNIATLVLSNDAERESIVPMNGMDIPEIENYLGAIHDACPQFELRLELPLHLASYAGALLVIALEGGTTEGIHYIRTQLPMNNALYGEIHGTGHQVINLSKPRDEKVIMTRIIPQLKHAGNGILYLKNPCTVENGDILLLTHMGTYGPETRVNDEGRNGVPERYLKARSLCRIKL